MADFAGASLQGANLSLAGLQLAGLRDAELDGADLQMARLAGADLSGAKLQGVDMRGAVVWRTTLPGGDIAPLADMAQIVMQQPAENETVAFGAFLARLQSGKLKARLGRRPRAPVGRGPERCLGHVGRPAGMAGLGQGQ